MVCFVNIGFFDFLEKNQLASHFCTKESHVPLIIKTVTEREREINSAAFI